MTDQEITNGVINVIADNSNFSASQIKDQFFPPDQDPNLDNFISSAIKARLARELQREFDGITPKESTKLTNDLFVTITTLGGLIKRIKAITA